jgi:hypothetical protein
MASLDDGSAVVTLLIERRLTAQERHQSTGRGMLAAIFGVRDRPMRRRTCYGNGENDAGRPSVPGRAKSQIFEKNYTHRKQIAR